MNRRISNNVRHPRMISIRARNSARSRVRRAGWLASASPATIGAPAFLPEQFQFLSEAGLALDESASVDDLEATVLALAIPRLADLCVVRLRADLASALERAPSAVHARVELLPLLRRSGRGEREILPAEHPATRVLATGEPDWGDVDAQRLEAVARDAEHLASLRAMGPVSVMIVPLASRGRTLGCLVLVSTRHSGRRYTGEDLALASELGRRVASVLDRLAQRELARQSVREQRGRLAATSHDLKDPLSTIQLALAFVRDQAFSTLASPCQMIRSQLDAAASAATRMRRLVERTLDELRGESAAAAVATEEQPTRGLFDDLVEQYRPQAAAGQVELGLVADPDLPPVALDADSMQRALANLVGNAIRFTPPGGLVVVGATATTARTVMVTVSDTGPGVSPEDRPRLFTPGWKRGRAHARGGSGLGLTIARRIVRSAGGEIGYRPSPTGGATFWMALPVR